MNPGPRRAAHPVKGAVNSPHGRRGSHDPSRPHRHLMARRPLPNCSGLTRSRSSCAPTSLTTRKMWWARIGCGGGWTVAANALGCSSRPSAAPPRRATAVGFQAQRRAADGATAQCRGPTAGPGGVCAVLRRCRVPRHDLQRAARRPSRPCRGGRAGLPARPSALCSSPRRSPPPTPRSSLFPRWRPGPTSCSSWKEAGGKTSR
jgi:hypothetical protein